MRRYSEAMRLMKSHEQTGSFECLNKVINNLELEISILGEYAPPPLLSNFGIMLVRRFGLTGSVDDLNQAIGFLNKAVDAVNSNNPERVTTLNHFAILLEMRFSRTRSLDDLNQAISILSELIHATLHDESERCDLLINLGNFLGKRFQRTGLIDDLHQAISVMSEAVDTMPHDDPDRVLSLNGLGTWLGQRFTRIGSIDDLNRAIGVFSEAMNAVPHYHPDRVGLLHNLGVLLWKRYGRMGSINDLDQAISLMHEGLDATPHNYIQRNTTLSSLGHFYKDRFWRTGSLNDLHQAASLMNQALDAMPPDYHSVRFNTLTNLASLYQDMFKRTESLDDLNQAINLLDEAANATSHDHPDRASSLFDLGRTLGMRAAITESNDDAIRMMTLYIASWRCVTAPPCPRIQAARAAAAIMMTQGRWGISYPLLREAISLLPTVSPRSLNPTDAQTMLVHFFGLASMATSAALRVGKAPGHALQLLELGRGVIASSLMDMRGDITDLRQEFPELAEKFTSLRDELDLPAHDPMSQDSTTTMSSQELQIKRRREADREFSEVIDTIRAQPGFFNFLQPPDVKELMGAAEQGPIIILNINIIHSDAFLIQSDSVQVINLPSLKKSEVQHTVTGLLGNSDLSPLLEWLWHAICHPCLDALGIKDAVFDDNWPHIWWIPTGLLSQLPLHAAGIYRQGSKETVLDRAISSYASSIKALLHGRKNRIQKPRQPPSEDSALIVSMQETPGLGGRGRLPFAADEVHMLRDICPQLHLASVTPSQNKEDILKHLPKCKIFHFAGHGKSDPRDPSRSCLLLEDWETNPLTVGDIRDSRLQDDPPFLAYLSACSTGANKVEKLADEGIHLISAFQLAGFRHAIGTLWEVSDKHCVDVARILYKTLQEEGMTDLAVSRGLHRAVRALRDGNADDVLTRDAKLVRPRPARQGVMDFFWVPYVHFGV